MYPVMVSINIILTAILLLFLLFSAMILIDILKKPVPYEQWKREFLESPAPEEHETEEEKIHVHDIKNSENI